MYDFDRLIYFFVRTLKYYTYSVVDYKYRKFSVLYNNLIYKLIHFASERCGGGSVIGVITFLRYFTRIASEVSISILYIYLPVSSDEIDFGF